MQDQTSLSVNLSDDWNVVGYGYLIDNDDSPSFSTNTFGGRLNGTFALGGGRVGVLADIARQSDAGNAPIVFDASYLRLQGSWSTDALTLTAGFESLGSDNGQGLRTPLEPRVRQRVQDLAETRQVQCRLGAVHRCDQSVVDAERRFLTEADPEPCPKRSGVIASKKVELGDDC